MFMTEIKQILDVKISVLGVHPGTLFIIFTIYHKNHRGKQFILPNFVITMFGMITQS